MVVRTHHCWLITILSTEPVISVNSRALNKATATVNTVRCETVTYLIRKQEKTPAIFSMCWLSQFSGFGAADARALSLVQEPQAASLD